MITPSLERCAAALGRPVARLAAWAAAAGMAAFVLGLALGHAGTAFAALDASFLFFAGLSAGSVAVAAAVRIAHGGWARPILPFADAGSGFFVPALALLVILLLGARAFIPWVGTSGPDRVLLLALRQLLPSALVFGAGWRFLARAHDPRSDGEAVRSAGVAYVLAYAVALSLWAYDLVMELSDSPPATVVPAYYFFGAFLSGLSWIALLAALRGTSGADLRHDLGKLLFAFIVVWSYLLWALFLPTWYGNIPAETGPLLSRWDGAYRPVTAAVLVAVFAWPFWLLFSERLKRLRGTLAIGAAAILLGMWAERFLMVLPSLRLAGGAASWLVGAGVALGVAGLFLLTVGSRLPALERSSGSALR